MVKKRSKILLLKNISHFFLMFLLFLIIDNAKASYSCGYGGNENLPVIIYEVSDDNSISFARAIQAGTLDIIDGTYIMDFEFDEKYEGKGKNNRTKILIDYFKGRCQKTIYRCKGRGYNYIVDGTSFGGTKYEIDRYAYLFDQQYQGEAQTFNGQMLYYEHSDDLTEVRDIDYINFSGNNECEQLKLTKSENAEVVEFLSYNCNFTSKYFEGNDEIKSLKSYYDSCKKGNSDDCLSYNNNKNIIKTYCYSTIEHSDYNNPCVYVCSEDVPTQIGQIESSFNGSSCHLSDKIIKFIANILKWVKYFAPALVIILSLLDFVKALAAQNDEDMKKSQSRFVKRLIAAVLLFIIPFLIQFALDKFNLVNSDPFCKII